jgi:hypothetical protein
MARSVVGESWVPSSLLRCRDTIMFQLIEQTRPIRTSWLSSNVQFKLLSQE